MKTTRNTKIVLAFIVCLLFGGIASAEGNDSARAASAMNLEKMKNEVYERLNHIEGQYIQRRDATVEVTFYVNAKGNVIIENIDSESSEANMAVVRELQKRKLFVAPELQNKHYSFKIRYQAI